MGGQGEQLVVLLYCLAAWYDESDKNHIKDMVWVGVADQTKRYVCFIAACECRRYMLLMPCSP